MTRTKSLTFIVTLWSAVAITCGMAGYAVYQHFHLPGATLKELFLEHLWHVLVLAAVIYGPCWLVIEQVVVRPLKDIYSHLYGIGAGRLKPFELRTNVTEIHGIVDAINLMLARMQMGIDRPALEQAQAHLSQMRDLLQQQAETDPRGASALLKHVAALEKSLLALLQSKTQAPTPEPDDA